MSDLPSSSTRFELSPPRWSGVGGEGLRFEMREQGLTVVPAAGDALGLSQFFHPAYGMVCLAA